MFACATISSAVCATFYAHVFLLSSTHHIEDLYGSIFLDILYSIENIFLGNLNRIRSVVVLLFIFK